jgi:hypothetical protein
MKSTLAKSISLLLFLFVASNSVNAQKDKKEHYKIINKYSESTDLLEKSLYHSQLDSLRFLNERRYLPVSGTKLVLELFSAQELKEKYAKEISPITIRDKSKAKKVTLVISSAAVLKAIIN